MKVKELIEKLETMPLEAEITISIPNLPCISGLKIHGSLKGAAPSWYNSQEQEIILMLDK